MTDDLHPETESDPKDETEANPPEGADDRQSEESERPGLLDRFPALQKLGELASQKRIPHVQQLTATECGAACLTMVLAYFGKAVRLEEVREVTGIGRDGATALALVQAAHYFGLRSRGVRIEIEDLEYLDPGSILHWEFNHFVVFERLRKNGVDIVDPAFGRRFVPMEQFRRSFTGVVLLLEPSDKFETQAKQDRTLWRHVKRVLADSRNWVRLLVTSLLLQVFALSVPVLTGALVDRVVPRGDYHLLLVLSIGLLSLVGFHFLASMIRAYLLLQLRTYLDARMTLGFLEHLIDLPYVFFQRRSAGDLMMRLNSNTTIREILTAGALSGLLDGTLVVVYLIILLVASPSMGLLVLVLGVLQIGVFIFTRRKQRDLMSENLHIQAKSQSYQVEMLTGIETLKAMGSEQRAAEHWSDLFVDVLNVSLARGRLSAWIDSITSTLKLGSPLLILGMGALLVLQGNLTLGTMLALTSLAAGFLGPLSNLVGTAGQLQILGSYLERIEDVLAAPAEQDPTRARQPAKLKGRITLEDVSFRYSPAAPMVVRNVSLEIAPGQFVAIVGRSGSGKSTLSSLLLGLYAPASGVIRYDGVDLSELDLRSVRRQVGIVTQRPYLFGTTIRANIALSDPTLPLDQVVEAARRARIDHEIAEMPLGFDSLLLDGGASLSGGQRQRVALARALVRQPAILLLDEATSSLDALTEREVQDELAKLRCTRVVIAHRLSTIVHADLILVLEDGRVVEQGRHDDLVKRRGVYHHLVSAQLEGEGK